MTVGGWITFLISVCGFLAFFAWCVYKVATAKKPKDDDLHGAFDIYEIENDIKQSQARRRSKAEK